MSDRFLLCPVTITGRHQHPRLAPAPTLLDHWAAVGHIGGHVPIIILSRALLTSHSPSIKTVGQTMVGGAEQTSAHIAFHREI